ncbi:hypothetical protein D3C76_1131830 [compost metagenome]
MRLLAAIMVLFALFGCIDGRLTIQGRNLELTHKCQVDPYKPDCLQPPPVIKGP